jgi:DNA-binding transcriptional LysR family regulator
MNLNEIAVFIKVVQTGSFTETSRQLHMPISTVSLRVSSLEKRLGVALLKRTTRKLSLTDLGNAYFNRCLKGLEEIIKAQNELISKHSEPQGNLKITAPVDLGSYVLPKLISSFTKNNPKVTFDITLTDRVVDLINENIDLAIRVGALKDSSFVAKKIGSAYFALYAYQTYLSSHKPLLSPKDLKDHKLLSFKPLSDTWTLTNSLKTLSFPLKGHTLANDLNFLKALALTGNGIALLPPFLCEKEVRSGTLVPVLPNWHTPPKPLHLVYAKHKFMLPALKSFIAFATNALKENFLAAIL